MITLHHLIIAALSLLGIIDVIFVIVLVFFERKDSASTWAWLLVLIFLPIVGAILYLLLGQGISKEKRFRYKIESDGHKNDYLKKLKKQTHFNYSSEHNQDVIRMNYKNCKALYTQNNSAELIFDGTELYAKMLESIQNAKEFVHMQFYIFRSDESGSILLDALCERAKAGIEVKLQVDGMGHKISKQYVNKLKESGVEFEVFFPSKFKILNLRANYRNHRKFLIVDGEYGYLGGFNIGKEYEGKSKLGYWRDTHMKIRGEALHDIEERFLLDWTYTKKQVMGKHMEKYFKNNKEVDLGEKIPMQIISSGPDHEREHIKNTYMKFINKASERVCIQSPYFIPDTAILDSLKLAALSGVEVNIMLPGKPDHFFIPWVANTYIGILLDYGVNVYLYQKGFIHAKVMIVDSNMCSVGTANMDIRSFGLNFETNAIMYSCPKAIELREKYQLDLEDCTKLTKEEFRNRPRGTKILESIFRLLSPIM